jgi:hypothetical protein
MRLECVSAFEYRWSLEKVVIVGRRWHQNARTDTLSVDLATDTNVSWRFPLLFSDVCVQVSTRTQNCQNTLFQATLPHARVTFPEVFTLELCKKSFAESCGIGLGPVQ